MSGLEDPKFLLRTCTGTGIGARPTLSKHCGISHVFSSTCLLGYHSFSSRGRALHAESYLYHYDPHGNAPYPGPAPAISLDTPHVEVIAKDLVGKCFSVGQTNDVVFLSIEAECGQNLHITVGNVVTGEYVLPLRV